MIQRAQTVYLGLAFICMVLLLFFPIFSVEMVREGVTLTAEVGKDGVVGEGFTSGQFPLYIVYIVLALMSMATILMFKNRPRQLLLARVNLVLHVLVVLAIYVFYYFGKSMVQDGVDLAGEVETKVTFFMGVGFFLLIPTVAFILLAVRGIKRDEILVKSLDRLR